MTCLYCDRPVRYKSNGMCNVHYNRMLRHGHPTNGPQPSIVIWDGQRAFEEAQSRRIAERDPCPWCGIRGDVGCRHSQRQAA